MGENTGRYIYCDHLAAKVLPMYGFRGWVCQFGISVKLLWGVLSHKSDTKVGGGKSDIIFSSFVVC